MSIEDIRLVLAGILADLMKDYFLGCKHTNYHAGMELAPGIYLDCTLWSQANGTIRIVWKINAKAEDWKTVTSTLFSMIKESKKEVQ